MAQEPIPAQITWVDTTNSTLEINVPTPIVNVKVKRLQESAVLPTYAQPGDAGLDLVATSVTYNPKNGYVQYGTGLALEIPEGYVGLVFPRSSVSKTGAHLANSVGIIDSGYRGEVQFRFYHDNAREGAAHPYNVGDRIGQLLIMPFPPINIEEVDELSDSIRGNGGFGSTGQ